MYSGDVRNGASVGSTLIPEESICYMIMPGSKVVGVESGNDRGVLASSIVVQSIWDRTEEYCSIDVQYIVLRV